MRALELCMSKFYLIEAYSLKIECPSIAPKTQRLVSDLQPVL